MKATIKNSGGDAFVTGVKAAELAGVTPRTIHSWTKAGLLKQYRIGPYVKGYRAADVRKLLVARAVK